MGKRTLSTQEAILRVWRFNITVGDWDQIIKYAIGSDKIIIKTIGHPKTNHIKGGWTLTGQILIRTTCIYIYIKL